jgi:transcriptional regulator with XRE-family HTH domain
MEIGKKLKEARQKCNLTQEQVSVQLFVSRQTISNWENEKSYPDIINIIKLSELYAVSLDELLKGDKKMMEHLEESTNVVESNKKLIGAVLVNILLLVVLLLMAGFLSDNAYMIAAVFSLSVMAVAFLLYQIVKRI